jgi:hypothetical protein
MIIFSCLAVSRTVHEVSGVGSAKVDAALRVAAQTVSYGPMLCVLFIACRMRVEFLSGGKDQPQMWVQNCMYGTTMAVLASTLVVMIIPMVTGKPLALKQGTCDLERPSGGGTAFYALSALRYFIQLGLYGGIAGVIVGTCIYLPPGATDLAKLPPPAPAVMCTMILAVIFFVTQLIVAGANSYNEFKNPAGAPCLLEVTKIVKVMNAAADTASFAPMLSVLFLAARMRALQHNGQPQSWAQDCMYSSTFSLALTTCLAVAVPLALQGIQHTDAATGQTTFTVGNPTMGYVLLGLRYLTMLGMYVGVVGVIIGIFTFEAPAGPAHTLPVSPAVQCVVNLCVQYFFIYLMLNVMRTIQELGGNKYNLEDSSLFAALKEAKATVAFAPMLSILFVTTRMYALLLTNKQGAPQRWVQDAMFMSTWSLMISFFMCLAMGVVQGKVVLDEDGNVINSSGSKTTGYVLTGIRYFAMLMLYGGMITVIYGLFTMTPENANGRGSIPFVTDAVGATPLGSAPPGLNDLATTPAPLF